MSEKHSKIKVGILLKDALDELIVRIPKHCKVSWCRNKPYILLLSKGGETVCYCARHYGKGLWIKRQKLFKNWIVYKRVALRWVLE